MNGHINGLTVFLFWPIEVELIHSIYNWCLGKPCNSWLFVWFSSVQAVCVNLGYTVPQHIKEAVNTQLETLPYLHLGEDLYPLQNMLVRTGFWWDEQKLSSINQQKCVFL